MSEIISLFIGQSGNGVCTEFLKLIAEEHGLSENGKYQGDQGYQLENIQTYFEEQSSEKYISRSINIDVNPTPVENLQDNKYFPLLNQKNFIKPDFGNGISFAKGYYTHGTEISNDVENVIRKEVEKTNKFQGFQFIHSIAGGTGSGLASLLTEKVEEEYKKKAVYNYTIFPFTDPNKEKNLLAPYNIVLSLHYLIELSHFTILLDNDQLDYLSKKKLQIKEPDFNNFNSIISRCISGVTSSMRFPGKLNCDLNKICHNLIFFPRLHFVCPSIYPTNWLNSTGDEYFDIEEFTNQFLNSENFLVFIDPIKEKYFTIQSIFRGVLPIGSIEENLYKIQKYKQIQSPKWMNSNIINTAYSQIPPTNQNFDVTSLSNTTAILPKFKRLLNNFTNYFKKKMYMKNFSYDGMEEMEFLEAEVNFRDLIEEIQRQKQF
ncbi:tubulin beta chain-related [Anaeramoeba flamelloides]|uniref:Tubulin beta chain n=1 Tax=Anaeramoeba flamelloides TaxID=1746091 RepID=A0AAV7ZKR2_9EUKA|nr:tubulin beta chain-related [Anaeramoeba flamelloides]